MLPVVMVLIEQMTEQKTTIIQYNLNEYGPGWRQGIRRCMVRDGSGVYREAQDRVRARWRGSPKKVDRAPTTVKNTSRDRCGCVHGDEEQE